MQSIIMWVQPYAVYNNALHNILHLHVHMFVSLLYYTDYVKKYHAVNLSIIMSLIFFSFLHYVP